MLQQILQSHPFLMSRNFELWRRSEKAGVTTQVAEAGQWHGLRRQTH